MERDDEPEPAHAGDEVGELVRRAIDGDDAAWRALVDRYTGLVWSVVRGFRLDHAAAADASQTVWLRLVQHLDRIEDPRRLAGWLATTARRECLHSLRGSGRELPNADLLDAPGVAPRADSPEAHLLDSERELLLWRAVGGLSKRCQLLLRVLAHEPDRSYADISSALQMPIGSIGPTRARCLDQLRRSMDPMLGEDRTAGVR